MRTDAAEVSRRIVENSLQDTDDFSVSRSTTAAWSVGVALDEHAGEAYCAPMTRVTDYHGPHSTMLVRLSRVDRAALRDLLRTSRRLTRTKTW